MVGGEANDLGRTLRVQVDYTGKYTVPNLAIHPQLRLPREPLMTQRYICFEARYRTMQCAKGQVPSLGLRLGDARHYQWRYTSLNERGCFPLTSKFKVYYADFRDARAWELMPLAIDGEGGPDLDMLTTLVFEFGFGSNSHHTSKGKATIEIKNICLCPSMPFRPRLLNAKSRDDYPLVPCYEAEKIVDELEDMGNDPRAAGKDRAAPK